MWQGKHMIRRVPKEIRKWEYLDAAVISNNLPDQSRSETYCFVNTFIGFSSFRLQWCEYCDITNHWHIVSLSASIQMYKVPWSVCGKLEICGEISLFYAFVFTPGKRVLRITNMKTMRNKIIWDEYSNGHYNHLRFIDLFRSIII